jgi:hypothetical protein
MGVAVMTAQEAIVLLSVAAVLMILAFWFARVAIVLLSHGDPAFTELWRGSLSSLPPAQPYDAEGVFSERIEKSEQTRALSLKKQPRVFRSPGFSWLGDQLFLTHDRGELTVEVEVDVNRDRALSSEQDLPLVVRVTAPDGKSASARLSPDRARARMNLHIPEAGLSKLEIAVWGAAYAKPSKFSGTRSTEH